MGRDNLCAERMMRLSSAIDGGLGCLNQWKHIFMLRFICCLFCLLFTHEGTCLPSIYPTISLHRFPISISLPLSPSSLSPPSLLPATSEMSGRTVLLDTSTDRIYIGMFQPGSVDSIGTAHLALLSAAEKAGLKQRDLVGASIKPVAGQPGTYTMGKRSESVNRNNTGSCEASPAMLAIMAAKLRVGDYYTVSVQGSINKGQRQWNIE